MRRERNYYYTKMRVIIFFGTFLHLLQYVTVRIYQHQSLPIEEKKDRCYCTINIHDIQKNTEKRWTLFWHFQSLTLFFELLILQLPSILADALNDVRLKKVQNKDPRNEDIDIIIQLFEENLQSLHSYSNNDFISDCQQFLKLLRLLAQELKYGRLLECHVVISELLMLGQKLFFISQLFNNFVSVEMIHILNCTYKRTKANKIWNFLMRKKTVCDDLPYAFSKKLV